MSDMNMYDYLVIMFFVVVFGVWLILITAEHQDEKPKKKVAAIKAKYTYTHSEDFELKRNRIMAAIRDVESLIIEEKNFQYVSYYQNERLALMNTLFYVTLEDAVKNKK